MSKGMVDLEDFLWGFSIISLALYFLQSLRKAISMASLTLNSPLSPPFSPPLSWANQFFLEKGKGSSSSFVTRDAETKVAPNDHIGPSLQEGLGSPASRPEGNIIREDERKGLHYGKLHCHDSYQKGLHEKYADDGNSDDHETLIKKGYSLDPLPAAPKVEGDHNYKGFANKLKKRPAKLVLPEYSPSFGFGEKNRKMENEEFEAQGRDFFLASKKGRREFMEDGYGVMVDILGDAKQAFFTVIDGHGGRAAADFVAENLGKNIVKALENVGKEEEDDGDELKQAIRGGYLVTDKEFLSQGVSSGACAASVLLKDGVVHVANVGDCRVVLSRKGVADVLTMDHRVNREDERLRIENSGGFLHCRNGIWRVHGSLAVSRAIGDQHLKQWIISEPEIRRVQLTLGCEFLILATDGLWDKLNAQEAVDIVLQGSNSVESCKKLVHTAFSRGNMDDITVMIVNLRNFMTC